MMMSLYRQSESRARRRLFFATLFVVVLFFADLISGGHLRALVRTATIPVWTAGSRAASAVFGSGFFTSRASLLRENALLQQQLSDAEQRAAGYQALKDENDSLRSIALLAGVEKGITAPVVSSVLSSPYGSFLIGAGSADELARGSIVLAASPDAGGFVIGRVGDVSAHTALVNELFAPGTALEATLKGAAVMLQGRGDNARADIPRELSVSVGDIVTVPSLGGRPVGVVDNVVSDPASSHQEVYIGLPVSISSLRFIYVVSR